MLLIEYRGNRVAVLIHFDLPFTKLFGHVDLVLDVSGQAKSRDRVAGYGEPWIRGMDPGKTSFFLSERGYRLLEDAGAEEYRTQYWQERGRRMQGFEFYQVALAEVLRNGGI